MSDQLKATAYAVLGITVVYFLAAAVGALGGNARLFLPLDILVYLAIGVYAARALKSWRRAFAVVMVAAFVDVVLAVGSLILPHAPQLSVARITESETIEFGFNALIGLVGVAIGSRIGGGAKRLPPLGAFAFFVLIATAGANAAPAISIVPSGPAADVPLVGRMLAFMQPVKDPKASVPANLDPGFVAEGFELAALSAGTYDVQALLDTRRTYTYNDIGAGDLLDPVQRVTIGPTRNSA